jgi:WD40 repeat protein
LDKSRVLLQSLVALFLELTDLFCFASIHLKNYLVFVALLRMVNSQELFTVEFQFGSVSSIDVSPDHSLILAGYSLGHISLWDSHKMTLLKLIEPVTLESEEGHISGSAIVAVAFHSNDRFYSADIQVGLRFITIGICILSRSSKPDIVHLFPDN